MAPPKWSNANWDRSTTMTNFCFLFSVTVRGFDIFSNGNLLISNVFWEGYCIPRSARRTIFKIRTFLRKFWIRPSFCSFLLFQAEKCGFSNFTQKSSNRSTVVRYYTVGEWYTCSTGSATFSRFFLDGASSESRKRISQVLRYVFILFTGKNILHILQSPTLIKPRLIKPIAF